MQPSLFTRFIRTWFGRAAPVQPSLLTKRREEKDCRLSIAGLEPFHVRSIHRGEMQKEGTKLARRVGAKSEEGKRLLNSLQWIVVKVRSEAGAGDHAGEASDRHLASSDTPDLLNSDRSKASRTTSTNGYIGPYGRRQAIQFRLPEGQRRPPPTPSSAASPLFSGGALAANERQPPRPLRATEAVGARF